MSQVSLGFHMSKWVYSTQTMIQNVSDQLGANGLAHYVMWMDNDHLHLQYPFIIDERNFPNITQFAVNLKNKHRFPVRIADPHLSNTNAHSLC